MFVEAEFVVLDVWISVLAVFATALVVQGLVKQGNYLTYPFLSGVVFLSWITPQLYVLSSENDFSGSGLGWLVTMAIACLATCSLGWRLGLSTPHRDIPITGLNFTGLLAGVSLLTAFGFAMQLLIGMRPVEELEVTMWSGPATIFAFFGRTLNISLVFSLLILLRHRSVATIALALVNLALAFPVAFIFLRRTEMVQFGIACAGALWFARRRTVPRLIVIGAAVVLTFIVFGIAEIRSADSVNSSERGAGRGLLSLRTIEEANIQNAMPWQNTDNTQELKNAAYLIDLVNRDGNYTLGRNTWNRFAFQYVPGQLVGYDVKSYFMFADDVRTEVADSSGFEMRTGSTETGLGNAYREFGLLGSAFFGLIAYILAIAWRRGSTGDIWAQAFYLSSTGLALVSITHYAGYFFVNVPLVIASIWALKLGSRMHRKAGPRNPKRLSPRFIARRFGPR